MSDMARKIRSGRQFTGLYYAREARGMSRSKLVGLSGVSKQQLSRLEGGQIRLRLDHLKPFAPHLGYSPEQILLWGRYPGTTANEIEASDKQRQKGASNTAPELVTELDLHATPSGRKSRKDTLKSESWGLPPTFVHEQLHTSAEWLVILEISGDSMAPTIGSGDRVIIDKNHKTPSPDGLYAIRDDFGSIVVKRLQLLRGGQRKDVKVISDNHTHATEEVAVSELDIVGKVVGCVKLY